MFQAYTQVVTLSVYAYLFSSLFSQQYLEPSGDAKTEHIFPSLNISFASQGWETLSSLEWLGAKKRHHRMLL